MPNFSLQYDEKQESWKLRQRLHGTGSVTKLVRISLVFTGDLVDPDLLSGVVFSF